MKNRQRHSGFSLTEVLIASGLLTIGFMLVAGTFPVGVKLTMLGTERSIGLSAGQEAQAKISLWGIDETQWNAVYPVEVPVPKAASPVTGQNYMMPYDPYLFTMDPNLPIIRIQTQQGGTADEALWQYFNQEQRYPSVSSEFVSQADAETESTFYTWSALCRKPVGSPVETTVFVSRKGVGTQLYPRVIVDPSTGLFAGWTTSDIPVPVPVLVEHYPSDSTPPLSGMVDEIMISDGSLSGSGIPYNDQLRLHKYFTPDSILVDGVTGKMMRVLDTEVVKSDECVIRLTSPAFDVTGNYPRERYVWVVPPAITDTSVMPYPVSGRCPCVGVYQ